MKTTTISALACLIATAAALAAPTGEPNRGVLNGPLTKGGHKAKGEGDRTSLRLAINDLMATHRSAYPKGPEFLKRLDAITNENSDEFRALKKEALLANPLLNFNHLLMVRSRGGNRFTQNWQTRSSSPSADTKLKAQDAEELLKALCKTNPKLAALNNTVAEQKRACDQLRKDIAATAGIKQNRKISKELEALYQNDHALQAAEAARAEAEKALNDAAMALPEYRSIIEKIKSGGTKPNYHDEIVVMSPICDGEITTVYKPEPGGFIGDVDLHFDGDRLLFSSHVGEDELTKVPNTKEAKGYAVFELAIDPATKRPRAKPRRVSPDMGWDVDNFDPCYLPDGRIIFASTAAYEGVPCVSGNDYVANLYIMNADGTGVRRLTFDQDGNWHPAMMENGRVMYTRWEYTDSAHYFSRILMSMNPDGTDQRAHYGSNSYWPNSMFFARQIPGFPSMFVATVTGHHSHSKGGAMCLFDVSKGTHEADGAVQLITGHGKKVEPLVLDNLAKAYDPMFFHPYPLSDKYFLAMTGSAIYLVDVFDNMLLLKASDGQDGYYEPLPLRKTPAPPVIPDKVKPGKEATVLLNDVYSGPGLAGVPRGTVKSLRISRYEYGPRNKGGHYAMGMEAGWDAKQVLGIAPVDDDGSASFMVPANTPLSMQPLDKDGKALQLMRSWMVAQPGEVISCVGCHEDRSTPPAVKPSSAMLRAPDVLKPFYGPTRGLGFTREVQPVIEKYCVGCHDGTKDLTADGRDRQGRYTVADRVIGTGPDTGKKFIECGIPDFSKPKNAHAMLHPYVRRNGPEGDYHLLTPLEFHADTSELFQMLRKGHHNVKLDAEAWDRLITWADLNAPFHGSWTEAGANQHVLARRLELRKLYAFDDYNPELLVSVSAPSPSGTSADRVMPAPLQRQAVPAKPSELGQRGGEPLQIDLGDGIVMALAPVPAGSFSMGSNSETPAEQPVTRVRIDKPFLMGTTEVTLEQYRAFDPDYLNGVYDMHYKDQVHRGYYMNDMRYPVIRVSWLQAMEFCQWLSKKTGKKVSLPTEAQWEWACRAGTDTPLSFGNLDADFSKFANLADITVKQMAVSGVNPRPINNPNPSVDFELKDPRSNDGVLHLAKVGSYQPNPWGIHDMHGNAAEWTRSDYQPYPYVHSAAANSDPQAIKTVRGGSWHDRPFRATSSYRLGFPAWQRVYHTGFRIVVEE